MAKVEELKAISLGNGVSLRFFADRSKKETALGARWTEASYDGKPGSEVLAIPPHWHRDHDEIMSVLEGEVDFTLDGVTKRLRPGDDPLEIPRGHVHSFRCIEGIKSTFCEETNPSGEFKEWFFRDFFTFGFPDSFWYTVRVFYDGDCYPSLPLGSKIVDAVVGPMAKLFVPSKKPLEELR